VASPSHARASAKVRAFSGTSSRKALPVGGIGDPAGEREETALGLTDRRARGGVIADRFDSLGVREPHERAAEEAAAAHRRVTGDPPVHGIGGSSP
jgi:hypothetical protein